MANAQAICTTFKKELLLGAHQFGAVTLVSRTSLTAPTTDVFKFALLQTTGSAGAGTTNYSDVSASEVSSANYTAGGTAVTNATAPNTSGTTAFWTPSANITWTTVTFTTDCAFLYNSTQSNKAVASFTFSSQAVSAGNFTLTMPTNDASNALIRIA
jgi:hypothetical protein